jgi:hypothetical protein
MLRKGKLVGQNQHIHYRLKLSSPARVANGGNKKIARNIHTEDLCIGIVFCPLDVNHCIMLNLWAKAIIRRMKHNLSKGKT